MKLAPHGKNIKVRKPHKVSEEQLTLLRLLAEEPGLTLVELGEKSNYSTPLSMERAVYGLINRGFIKWQKHSKHNVMSHYVTEEGRKLI